MNRARKIRNRVYMCVCEGEATAAPSGERVVEMHRFTSSEAIGGTFRWANRRKIIRKRRNSKREWSDSEVICLSFGWQMSFSRHGQRLEDESLTVSGVDVGKCPARALLFSWFCRSSISVRPTALALAAQSRTHQLSSAWISRLRCATLTSAHTLPSVCVTDLGKRTSAPVHTQSVF